MDWNCSTTKLVIVTLKIIARPTKTIITNKDSKALLPILLPTQTKPKPPIILNL